MKRIWNFWKIIVFDTLGFIFMIAALLTSPLPGPGGIPLFLIGLSLLAINHEWARRIMVFVKKHANEVGDKIFSDNPTLQRLYDVAAPFLLAVSAWLLWRHSALWMWSLGFVCVGLGFTLLLGNRHRFQRLKKYLKHKR